MKMLFVYSSTYPWDVRVEKMTAWLGARGHDVHLLCANHDRAPEREHLGALTVHRLRRLPRTAGPLQTAAGLPSPLNPVWFLATRALVRQERPEVVVVRDLQVALAATAAAHGAGLPVVLDLAENWPSLLREWRRREPCSLQNLLLRHPAGSRVVERLAVHRVDHVIVVVEEMQERLVRELAVPPSRVTVVTNTPWVRSLAVSPGSLPAYTLVYFGMLHPDHGLDTALAAVAAARATGLPVRLRVIGRGKPPLARFFRRLTTSLGLDDAVEFVGWLATQEEAFRLAAEAHVGLCPSPASAHHDTTITNKMFEYMMLGLPVLCSDVRPQKRTIEETGAGLVFGAGCAEDMARAIRQLADPALRETCAAAGKRAVAERYHWDFDARILEGVLTSASLRRATPARGGLHADRGVREHE